MIRMLKERMEKAQEQKKVISKEDYEKVKALAGICKPLRSFIHKIPKDHGMNEWEDLVIPSNDGVPLEAWYIPAKGGESENLIIFNHALPMCRSGFPGHLGEPWSNFDEVEIDFVLQYKHLTDAGYNVLTYDLRNHGHSGSANGGISGIGQYEWRDCVGVKKFVDAHTRFSKMNVGLYSQCMGGNAQYHAIHKHPELFENVKCMVSPMVVSMSALYDAFAELQGIGQYQELLDLELLKIGGCVAAEMTPHLWANSVTIPVLMVQVLDDAWTRNPEDAQQTFDLLGSKEKELIWIENTTKRFKDGYNYFGRHPEKILSFIDKYMKVDSTQK
ncbi:MAG: alpha/beta hydrolase [Cyanobacteria bacterium P01_H01_bin.35]